MLNSLSSMLSGQIAVMLIQSYRFYLFQVVGKWIENSLKLNLEDVVWNSFSNRSDMSELPTSACSLPCAAGMIKKQQVIERSLVHISSAFFSFVQ